MIQEADAACGSCYATIKKLFTVCGDVTDMIKKLYLLLSSYNKYKERGKLTQETTTKIMMRSKLHWRNC